jgi:hypothetical protein
MIMKLFKLISVSILISGLFSSCATVNHVNGKIIIGSWKLNKVVSYSPASQDANAALSAFSTADDESKSSGNKDISEAMEIKKMVKESFKDSNYSALLSRFPGLITAVAFRQDNTGSVTTPKEQINGTWKINRTGTKITLKEPETKKVIKLELRTVEFTKLELINTLPEGTFIVQYRK